MSQLRTDFEKLEEWCQDNITAFGDLPSLLSRLSETISTTDGRIQQMGHNLYTINSIMKQLNPTTESAKATKP